jgi:hypothetical protein
VSHTVRVRVYSFGDERWDVGLFFEVSYLLCQLCLYGLSDVRTCRGPWEDLSEEQDPRSRCRDL